MWLIEKSAIFIDCQKLEEQRAQPFGHDPKQTWFFTVQNCITKFDCFGLYLVRFCFFLRKIALFLVCSWIISKNEPRVCIIFFKEW